MDAELTNENPDLANFDLDALAGLSSYPDGSGGGIRTLAWEMKNIREVRARIATLEAFVRKHCLMLGKLNWDLEWDRVPPKERDGVLFVPEITLVGNVFNKSYCQPCDIASLWPDAAWSRALPYCNIDADRVRDYVAEVDGVILRIKRAEVLPPPKKTDRFGPCSRVRIPKKATGGSNQDA